MSTEIMTAATIAGIMGAAGITSGTATGTNPIPTGAGNTGAQTTRIATADMATAAMATDAATAMTMAAMAAPAITAPAGPMTKQTFLGWPTNVCLEFFVLAEFLSQNRWPLLGNSA